MSSRLDQWRRARGLTFAELGDRLGVSKPTAWRLCRRAAMPSRETMRRIAGVTEGAVTIAAFYQDSEPVADEAPP